MGVGLVMGRRVRVERRSRGRWWWVGWRCIFGDCFEGGFGEGDGKGGAVGWCCWVLVVFKE